MNNRLENRTRELCFKVTWLSVGAMLVVSCFSQEKKIWTIFFVSLKIGNPFRKEQKKFQCFVWQDLETQ